MKSIDRACTAFYHEKPDKVPDGNDFADVAVVIEETKMTTA
jgi:hypothetical protein